MVNNVTVGLIAAAAAIGGAFLSGLMQAYLAWQQRIHERNQQKVEGYREVLRHLWSMPGVVSETLRLPEDEANARLRDYGNQFRLLRADLALYASSDIRKIADEDLYKKLSLARDKFPSAQRFNMIQWYKVFEKEVQPAIERLADAMAEDTNLRKGKRRLPR